MNRLRELRKSKKLTLKETVEKLKVQNSLPITADTLAKYERGDREPKIETWQKLANFFNVSVPYIQGTDRKTFSMDEIIEIINEYYFESLNQHKSNTVGSNFVRNVNLYIRKTSNDPIPSDFFAGKTKKSPLDTKKYWLKHFRSILESSDFKYLPKGGKEFPKITYKDGVFILFAFTLEAIVSELTEKKQLTSLGSLYMDKFNSTIEQTYDETIEQVKYSDLVSAKSAINKFSKIINSLKKEIENFKPSDAYFDDYFKSIMKEESNIDSSLKDDHLIKLRKAVLNEIIKRVKDGNKDLRNNIINQYNKADLIKIYRNYKIEHGEDTSELNDFSYLFEEDQD